MQTFRFDRFEIDVPSAELRRDGRRIALAPKVAELLLLLVESGGRLVLRAELQDRLWPDTHTDRERGLNNAINRLREALEDSAAEPRYIETVPKRGYRFVAPIESAAPSVSRRAIAGAIAAGILLLIVSNWNGSRRVIEPPAPPEYWAALRRVKLGGTRDLSEARTFLETARRKSPTFAPAHAELASVLLDLIDQGKVEPVAGRQMAANAAQTALRLHNNSSAAHLAMGLVWLRAEWRLQCAASEIDRAISLDPNSAEAWRARATLLLARGDASHAVEAAERSVSLDPISPWIQTASGRAIYYKGDNLRSVEQLQQAVQIAPEFGPAHRYLSEAYWQAGRREDALREFMATLQFAGVDPTEMRRIDQLTAQEGLPGYWRAELGELRSLQNRYGIPHKLAAMYAAMNQPDDALECLSRAVDQKDTQTLFLRVNPRFDKLRADPRFQAILRRIPSS